MCSELMVRPVNAYPPNPSSRTHPLEGELVVLVAEPEMRDFRRMFEGVLPHAMQGVKPWGAATPAAKHPGACAQVILGTYQSSALKAGRHPHSAVSWGGFVWHLSS